MNITDQIISDANRQFSFEKSQILNQAKIFSNSDKIKFYKKRYSEKSNDLYEIYPQKLNLFPPENLLDFNFYSELVKFFSSNFHPINTIKEIEFHDFDNNIPANGNKNQPVVKKGYDFALDNERGIKLSDYLKSIMLLIWIKGEIGYDIKRYPVKKYVVAFENGNTIFIFYNVFKTGHRLYYDVNGNDKILQEYAEFIYREKNYNSIFPLIQDLPYFEGDEAQFKFDIEWYKHEKQSPLNYRCFPVYYEPGQTVCRHKGEYCIDKNELDDRYDRFLNVYQQLEPIEKEELILNSMDYFERFLKTDCFENSIDRIPFEKILSKLKSINSQVQENKVDFDNILSKIKFDKNEETKLKAKEYFLKLSLSEIFKETNDKEFTAVALIFFQTGWITNTKTFNEWLIIFAEAFGREKSSYKPNQVKEYTDLMKTKIPFLDKLPKK